MGRSRHIRDRRNDKPPFRLPFEPEVWHLVVERWKFAPKQAQVAELILLGLKDKEVSSRLGMSYHTVRTHLCRIFERCDAEDRTEMVLRIVASAIDIMQQQREKKSDCQQNC